MPKELQSQFFLSNVKLKWNEETHSYISEGPIGIGSIGKTMINKQATGVVEIRKKHAGDELNIFIEFDSMHWYFFHYYYGQMNVVSSNDDFMNALNSIKLRIKENRKPIKGNLISPQPIMQLRQPS